MCGVAGFIYKADDRRCEEGKLKTMADIISHRGPDGEGYYIENNVAFAHRRLSIVDLSSAGHQPMESANHEYIIVYNGMIYNYLELKEELADNGHNFSSESDTEVILKAYEHWGKNCVCRFNGMWAFALFDRKKNEIFFSRDRFGIKPFYYVNNDDYFAFASEIKSILAGFPNERKANEAYIRHFLPSGVSDDGEETFFENVKILMPAHNGVLRLDTKQFSAIPYWDLDEDAFHMNRIAGRDPESALWELLNSSLDIHLRADVPIGSCLSGGIDSSTIVGIIGKNNIPVHTYSGIYPDKDCDEKFYVDSVNSYVNTVPHLIYPEPNGDLLSDLEDITWYMDEPSGGPGLYTQYHVMKTASSDIKVILDGQGGDELFGGYLTYYSFYIQDLLDTKRLTYKIRAGILMIGLYKHFGKQWGSMELAQRIFGKLTTKIISRLFRAKKGFTNQETSEPSFFHPDLIERVKGNEIERSYPKMFKSNLNNILYWHLVKQSVPALLHYEDRNSMAFSIEARVPYLDYRIVEFALALPSCYKIRKGWTKWILRKSACKVAPEEVAWRRSKLGYPTPFARWIREGIDKEKIAELLFSESFLGRKIVAEETVRFYYDQHISGLYDRSWLLYRYITLELWYRMFIDGFGRSMQNEGI